MSRNTERSARLLGFASGGGRVSRRTTGLAREARFGRSAGKLSAGVGASGLLTYAYFSLASHNLDPTSYGEIVVLWSSVFVTISLLHRPVEQFISRSVAEHRERSESAAQTMRTAALLQGAIALTFAVAALALRGPLEDDLLSGNETLYWIYVVAVLCFAASFFARGFLAGSQQFGLLAGLLVCESFSRTLFALAVAVGIAEGQNAVALGIAAAPIFSLLVVPLAFRHRASGRPSPDPVAPGGEAEEAGGTFGIGHGAGFAGAVFWIMFAEQAMLNGGPLLVKGLEGAVAAGFVFNLLMLARAPLLVFQGVAISLLPHLTRLRSRSDEVSRAAFEVSVEQTLRAVAVFTLVVAVIVAIAGPALMEAAFGEPPAQFSYDRLGLLIVTAAMGLYLAATTLNQAALAHGRARRAAVVWVACACGFIAWCVLPVIDAVDRRVEIGFALAAAALCTSLWQLSRHPRADDEAPEPGSADEITARLALADEVS